MGQGQESKSRFLLPFMLGTCLGALGGAAVGAVVGRRLVGTIVHIVSFMSRRDDDELRFDLLLQ